MKQDDAGFRPGNGHSSGLVSIAFSVSIPSTLSIPVPSVPSIPALRSSFDGRHGSGFLVRLAGARSP